MTKQEMAVTMAEFMVKYPGYVMFNPRKIERMAQEQFAAGQDLLISTEEYLFRISQESIAEYFRGASEPIKAPVPPVVSEVKEEPKVEIVDVPQETIIVTKKVGRPKKEV